MNDDSFYRTYESTEAKILKGYKLALNEVRKELASLFESFDKPSVADLQKYNRLEKLAKRLTEIIALMTRQELNILSSDIKETMGFSFKGVEDYFNEKTKSNIDFGSIPDERVKFALTNDRWRDRVRIHNARLLTDTLTETENMLRTNARKDIAEGLSKGSTYADVTKAIKEKFNITATRAKTITFDQMHAAHMSGRNEGIKKAIKSAEKLGLSYEKTWKHNGAKQPRPDHISMNGRSSDKDGIFTLPSGSKGEAPGLMDDVSENVYCHCSMLFNVT